MGIEVKNMNNKYEKIVLDRFSKHGISIKDVLNKVDVPLDDKTAIFLYMSEFENLGTKDSDIDVYIISDHIPVKNFKRKYLDCLGVNNLSIKGLEFDIEYWHRDDLLKIVNQYKNGTLMEKSLIKILLRLDFKCTIIDNLYTKMLIDILEKLDIKEYVENFYLVIGTAFYDDAIKLYNAKEYISSLDCCRNALWNVVAAINAQNNFPNLKEKWVSKIFLMHRGYGDEEALKKYYKFQVFPSVPSDEGLISYIEEFLEFINTSMMKVILR